MYHYFANKGLSSQDYGFSSGHIWTWELDYKENWALKNWCFWTVVLKKTLKSPLDGKEIQPVHSKGDPGWWTSWVFPLLWLILQIISYCCCCCSVAKLCLSFCNPMDCSMPGFRVHHQLWELALTHGHWVGDAIQPSHPLSSPSPPALNLSQHQGFFQWVSSSHQVAKVLEFQL